MGHRNGETNRQRGDQSTRLRHRRPLGRRPAGGLGRRALRPRESDRPRGETDEAVEKAAHYKVGVSGAGASAAGASRVVTASDWT